MDWVESEFEELDLGDHRLNRRTIKVVEGLGLAPGRTIPQTFQSRGEIKACYNLFDNDLVSEKKLLEPHIRKTIERIQEYSVVLLISDTTEIDYTNKKAMKGKERLSNKKQGLWLHATTAVTPERLTLGLIDANFWHRNPEVAEKSSTHRTAQDNAPIEEKESYRWLQSYTKSCEIAKEIPGTQIINITDREADIIEIFEEAQKQEKNEKHAQFIIRSQYDRIIEEENPDEVLNKKLRQRLKEAPSMGEIEFTISPTEERKGRKVKQQIKAASVTLKPAGKKLKIKVNAVMAIEENAPEGERPLIWILITNLPILNFDSVVQIIRYYLCRWEIELFFKVLKSGCKIEERQLQTTERMKNLISIFIVLSWRVMFTIMLGRVCSDMSAGDLFEAAEWKSVCKILDKKKALPRKPPRLGDFIIMVATLGGYVAGKNAAPPGVKVMWKGMARMIDFAIAWEAFRE